MIRHVTFGYLISWWALYCFIRPSNRVVGGLSFYRNSSSFFRQLPYKLAERNSTKTSHTLGSECDL